MEDDSRWDEALEVVTKVTDVLHGVDYSVAMNALLLVVAHGGTDSTLNKQEFLAMLVEQVGSMYDSVKQGEKTWQQ
jgi:hypothetical protein